MSCPTCDHTMGLLVSSQRWTVFLCERCGTSIVNETDLEGRILPGGPVVPKLIDRCLTFEKTLGPEWTRIWIRLGITEAIHLPADRPTPRPT